MTKWINTVSRGHVQRGVAGGFTQANHGKPHMLRRMARDDWIIFYSPKTDYPDGDPLRAFTAIGRVSDDEVYQEDFDPQFQPWRRRVEFLACRETPIRPSSSSSTSSRTRRSGDTASGSVSSISTTTTST